MDQRVGTDTPTSRLERLLTAGRELMVAKGFAATTVDQVCEAAGVTKGAFFHYFGTKEDMANALVERFAGELYMSFQEAPFRKLSDPRKRVFGYIEWTKYVCREPILANGCLLGIFSQELASVRPEIRDWCAGAFDAWRQDFQNLLDEAQPPGNVDTAELARHFIGIVEGSLILSKAHQDPDVVDTSLDQFRNYVKTLFGSKRKGKG